MEHDVFISYHRNSSAELVDNIVHALESHGIKCWYAPRDVEAKYAGDIVRAIEKCKIFLLIMNEQSSRSEHVLNEINYAFNRFHQKEAIRLLPFRTDNAVLSDDVKYYLGRIHFLDGSEPPENERIDALVSRVSYWLQSESRSEENEHISDVSSKSSDAARVIRSASLVYNTNFVGRTEETKQIYTVLHNANNKLFLTGVGGIGKSELAKQYALQFGEEYKTVLWFSYNGSIEDMVISDQFLSIRGLENENQDLTTQERREAYYYKKLNYLKDYCGKDTLIIVDNFDSADKRLEEFLQGKYSMIFTSRLSWEKEGYQEIPLRPLNDKKDQLQLFQKFYKRPLKAGEEELISDILEEIGCHTYGIELLAKQMQASRMSPSNMLDFLKGKQTSFEKRSRLVMEYILDVMGNIFKLSNLSEEKLSILKNMTLLPIEGIETERFFELTDLEDFMLIDELIDSSFLQYNYITDVISLHPLVGSTVYKNYPQFVEECHVYIKNLTEQLSSFTHFKYNEKMKLLSLAENFYLKWCDADNLLHTSFMERLAEAYAEYFMRDKSISVMERLLDSATDTLKKSWYHYYIANQRRCLFQYDELSKEAALSLSEIETVPESPEMKQQLSLSYSMTGWAKYHENNIEEAVAYFEKSLDIRKEILPENDVLIAWGYYNSANAIQKMGETELAIQYYEEAIRRFLQIDEIGICVPAYISIAEAYLTLGDFEKANASLNQAFMYEYEYYGEENCRKYWLYEVKAKILEKQGNLDEAEKYLRMSKEEYEKIASV